MILTNANLIIFRTSEYFQDRYITISSYVRTEISGHISGYLARKSKTKEIKMLLKMLSR